MCDVTREDHFMGNFFFLKFVNWPI